MKARIIIIFISLMTISLLTRAESSIVGVVIDDKTGEVFPFANIGLYKENVVLTGTTTDFNGYYSIRNIEFGEYTLIASYLGYKKVSIENIKITEDKVYEINIKMEPEIAILSEVAFVEFRSPIISSESCSKSVLATSVKGIYNEYSDYYNSESYDQINDNKFKSVKNDPLSTFSVDVDRASYSNIRRFLNNSELPPADAVRIEEMINYFDYDYPKPDKGHPFGIHMEVGNCPWNTKNKLLLVGIQGESMDEEDIPPCNLVFLIDVSGSMSSKNKLPLLKSSFKLLVDKLRPEDRVSIVVYASSTGCVLPSTSGRDKDKIMEAINNLNASGSTAGGEGIQLAYKIASENFIKGGNNRVILATDGDFNVGISSDNELEKLIEGKKETGVYLTILGFGMGNYKDSKMERLSNKGNGNYVYIDNIREADKVFSHELWGTLYTIAKDVKIQIEFNPLKVKEYRLIGYENRILDKEDFNDDEKDAGDIGSGHSVTALYELVLEDGKKNKSKVDKFNYQETNIIPSDDLITLKLRYKKPDEDESSLIEKRVSDKDISLDNNSDSFMLAVSVAEFGMLLRDSKYKGKSSYDSVLSLTENILSNDKHGYRSEFVSLVKTARILSSK